MSEEHRIVTSMEKSERDRLGEIDGRLSQAWDAARPPWGYEPGKWNDDVVWDMDGMGALWPVCRSPQNPYAAEEWPRVAPFLAHAPGDVTWLLGEVRRLQGEVDSLRGVMDAVDRVCADHGTVHASRAVAVERVFLRDRDALRSCLAALTVAQLDGTAGLQCAIDAARHALDARKAR